jgi:hypothetical protein
MTGVIWSGAGTGSDIFFLVAAIVAAINVAWLMAKGAPEAALLPLAVAFVAVGLLAI